ncbi:tetratricopeptide repeat protein [Scytonema sp. UIC 10036]|uniref:tetratricopeptide repeat protein n=1 Tax=Scytonema sp. UIC 10036 TaxID=2304196 RepID=UPI0012DAD82D|nr:tetratricopeptide repeat protein [Scytonema sp. UIC 10036]MUG94381.1 tetratricopeptide repeat protein [Scytonema sp. UIC 10036]
MKNLAYWQNWLNREKIILLIGSLFLLFGATFPWYRLPTPILEAFGTNLVFTNIGRIVAGMFAFLGLAFTFLFSISHAPRSLFWTGLISVLLFPYFITTWSPKVAFIASSYYKQVESVSYHVNSNFSEVQAQWKQNIFLDKPEPPPTTFELSIQDSRFFQLPSWDKVLQNGLGYKNSFFSFIGKGWSYSWIGFVISLIGYYLADENKNVQLLIRDVSLFFLVTVLLLTIILISQVGVNIVNYQLETQFAKGEYGKVVNISKTLASWYPPLQGDEAFFERLAKAEFYGGEPEPALLNFVKGLEHYKLGDFQEAENDFQKSLYIQPNLFLARGYLASAILNQGVNYLKDSNIRKPGTAADIFEKVLQIFPNHVEALYDLMLARVVNGEFQKSAETAKQIIQGQQYFQEPSIGLLGQAYLHLAWADYHNDDINKTWERYRQSVDPRTWSKFSGEEK